MSAPVLLGIVAVVVFFLLGVFVLVFVGFLRVIVVVVLILFFVVVVIDLASVFGSSLNYSGILHIVASNSSPVSLSSANTSAYVLLVTKSTGGSGVVEIAKNGLVGGSNSNWPSFRWTLDTTNNHLEASPVGSTSGNFYFYIGQFGAINAF